MHQVAALVLMCLLVVATNCASEHSEGMSDNGFNRNSNTVHIYVLLVPDSSLQELKMGRQEESGTLTEVGAYVGQIISGVLGGDVRPIFAGTTSLIGEPDVSSGVGTILANVAPSLNNILKGWINQAQTALGFSTTPVPGQTVSNLTVPARRPWEQPPYGTNNGQPQQSQTFIQSQAALIGQELAQLKQKYPLETPPGSNTVSGSNKATTVPPLPLINLNPDEDDDSV